MRVIIEISDSTSPATVSQRSEAPAQLELTSPIAGPAIDGGPAPQLGRPSPLGSAPSIASTSVSAADVLSAGEAPLLGETGSTS